MLKNVGSGNASGLSFAWSDELEAKNRHSGLSAFFSRHGLFRDGPPIFPRDHAPPFVFAGNVGDFLIGLN